MNVDALLTDWLAAGPLIVERLRAKVPGLRLVAQLADLANIEQAAVQVPAAFVAYDGDRYAEGAASGMAQHGAQRWQVVLAVRNASVGGNGAGVPGEAGPLLPQIGAALAGWSPFDGGRPLRRVTALRPGYTVGFGYYPLAFELDFVTTTPRPQGR